MSRSPRFINSLRDTLTPASKQLQEEPSKKEESRQTLLALKKSSETRADVYGSGTMTITDSKSREDLLDRPFLSAQEIVHPADKMQKS
jgi:hypothetical protein